MSNPYGQLETPSYILELINQRKTQIKNLDAERELVLAREVYKDINIKRENNTSRVKPHEDEIDASALLRSSTSSLEKQTPSQSAFVVKSADVITSSRYSGISIQHCITKTGVKLAITLQTLEEQATGACLELTAELKRYDRMHEVKAKVDDSDWFNDYIKTTIASIKSSQNRSACLGRLHDRGKRSEWFLDSLVVGFLNGDSIQKVWLNLEGEEYIVDLDQEISERQKQFFKSTGLYGNLSKGRGRQRRLSTAQRTQFGGEL